MASEMETLKQLKRVKHENGGRPSINRELAYQLIQKGYSPTYIRKVLRCSPRALRKIKQEMKEKGLLNGQDQALQLSKSELAFDEDCKRATGMSFYEWLKARTVQYRYIFAFNEQVWETVFERTPVIILRDMNNTIADTLVQKWIGVFAQDPKTSRRAKKIHRFFWRFLGRHDILERHLRMTIVRDLIAKKEIPEITMPDFPNRLEKAISLVREKYGEEGELIIKLKIVTQMRTGSSEKELMGITVGGNGSSYLIMDDIGSFRFKVLAKRNEEWIISWLPTRVQYLLYSVYSTRERGQKLIQVDTDKFVPYWKECCVKAGLPPMNLHDLRKVSITWLWVMGVPLEVATTLNCGWKDLNTARDHYLQYRALISKSAREQYKQNIPEWFKDGLDEYVS